MQERAGQIHARLQDSSVTASGTAMTAANGKPYATAKVRVPTREGDALFVDRNGNARPSVDLAHGVLTPYHVARKRKLIRDIDAARTAGDLRLSEDP